MSAEMLLTMLAVFGPAAVLVWWFRRQTTSSPPWIVALAVLGATFCYFHWPTLVLYFWQPWSTLLWNRGINRDAFPLLYPFIEAFGMAAIPEEAFKFVILLMVSWMPVMLASPKVGAVLGAFTGIGHAVGENAQDLAAGVGPALLSGGLKLLVTTSWGLIMGYWLWKARAQGSRSCLAVAILAPVLLHGFSNFGLFVGQDVGMPYLDREELPPWPVLICMLAMPVTLLTTLVWGALTVRRAFWPNNAMHRSRGSGVS